MKRTTIELDEQLLSRAQRALGCTTMRATIEEALRRVAQQAEDDSEVRRSIQLEFLSRLAGLTDSAVMASDEMWQ
jgi:Arc/MetJ family transcription regulator